MFSTVSKNIGKYVVAFIMLALIFYSPRRFGIDFGSLFCVFFGGFGFFYRIKNWIKNKEKPFWTEAFFGYLLLYSFVLFAFTGLENWQDHGYYFLRLVRAFSLYYVFYFLHDKLKLSGHELIKLLLAVFGIHFALVFLQYFPPLEWRLFFLKLNPIYDPLMNPDEFQSMIAGKRVKGAMMGFDGAGIIIAYVVGLGLVVTKKSILRMGLLFLGFLGVLITSRTGAVVFLGIAALYFMNQLVYKRKIFWKEFLGLGVICAIAATLIFTFYSDSSFVTKSLHNSFEFVYSYEKTGHAKIESLDDTIQNHLIITKDDLSFFGSPQRQKVDPSGKILSASQSDCGYLQVLANFGIPNTLLIVGVHLFLMIGIFSRRKTIFDMRIILLFMFLIASIKGPYFFGRMVYDLIILIFFVESLERKTIQKGNSFYEI